MRIAIATVQVPFVNGGAEAHASNLKDALLEEGHEAAIVSIPFKWYPPERLLNQMLACRLLDLTESNGVKIDGLIGLKFPAYFIPHPNKVIWMLHQHREAYELWDYDVGNLIESPDGEQVQRAIKRADRHVISEAKQVFANSKTVRDRLRKYCDLESEPLYHPPPNCSQYYCARDTGDYFFFPSRLTKLKRQRLVLQALRETKTSVSVYFAGEASDSYGEILRQEAERLGVQSQIRWLGLITEKEKRRLYAQSLAVIFPPLDEDYGYVTLEAMLASKAVVTCRDSGGAAEFVRDRVNGIVAAPTPTAVADAMDGMWENKALTKRWGAVGRCIYDDMDLSWSKVIRTLLSSFQEYPGPVIPAKAGVQKKQHDRYSILRA
jgi:glycosyltransferase involved in cell wall biosynthesis